MSQNYQNSGKNSLQKGNSGRQNWKLQKPTQQRIPDYLREYNEIWTHTGFFLNVSLKWRYTACKTLYFAAIVELSAACPFCFHGSPVKITLCHAQSLNSAFARCVNLGLPIPPKYHNTLGRQKNINLLPILYRLWRKQWHKLGQNLTSGSQVSLLGDISL